MAGGGFRCWRKNRLWQEVRYTQPHRQLNATDFSADSIVLPARAGDVTSHDAFNRQRLRLSHDHGAACELVPELVEGRRKIRGAEDMVGDDVLQEIEPEERELSQNAALVGNGRGKDDVEGGKPIRGDDQQLAAEIVDVTDFAARGGFQAGELRLSYNS